MSLQELRRKNLRSLIKQWDGPSNLANKLHHSGPSYLSQLVSGRRPITEKTARAIEAVLELPAGWLDADQSAAATVRIDPTLINAVMRAVMGALEEARVHLTPNRLADLVSLVYTDAAEHGRVNETLVARVVRLLTKE